MQKIISFLRNQSGASSIEYALLAAVVAGTIVVAVTGLGSSVNSDYTSVAAALRKHHERRRDVTGYHGHGARM
jgi:pilus assembly protein Flp/PilA